MNQGGYKHNDFHPGNIGYVNGPESVIKIPFPPYKIPTLGKLYTAIDMGFITHKKYDNMRKDEFKIPEYNDIIVFFGYLWKDHLWDYISKNKIAVLRYEKVIHTFLQMEDMKHIRHLCGDIDTQLIIFRLMYPILYSEILATNQTNAVRKKIISRSRVDSILPTHDLVYMLSNHTNLKNLINYLLR